MITPEILAAVFAAQDGNVNATQMLYKLVENPDSEKCSLEELCQKLTLSYELLQDLVKLSEAAPSEPLIDFLQKSVGAVTKEKYVECVNILRFYGYTLLVKFVENSWHLAPSNLKLRCRFDVESLFSYSKTDQTVLSEYTPLVNQKAAQYIATLAVREWPGEWVEFIPFCVSSLNHLFTKLGAECKANKQALNEIAVFWGVISEISIEIKECLDETILHKRRISISNLLKTYIYDIFLTIHRVILLGVVSSNEQLIYTILTIFRNLSCILDGFIFISFDIDEFLAANVKSVKTSDVIQTVSNICLDVSHKKIKDITVAPELDLGNEQLYKAKLDRFLKNLIMVSEYFALDFNYNSTLDELQLAQAFKNLLDKNSLYLIENVPPETLRVLFEYLISRMIMHPSIEVATCTLNACSLLLRRILSIRVKKGEDIAQKLPWLDYKKLILCLFLRALKLGNPQLCDPFFAQTPDVPGGPIYAGLAILDPVIVNITKHFKSTYDWINSLFTYCQIDDEIAVGQMKNFESRFAALRSTILHCSSLVAIISPVYMDSVLMVVSELLASLSPDLAADCGGYCCTYRKSEKHLSYVCTKYILFDGILFVFESAIFRLRSATIDLSGSNSSNALKDEKMYWLNVDLYKELVLDLSGGASAPLTPQGHSLSWIRTAMSLILTLMNMKLTGSHRHMLDVRRLDSLSSLSILFLYNRQYVGNVLGFVVNKVLFEITTNISNLNKCALQCLGVFCKNCKTLIGPYLDIIASKIHHCLTVVTNENSKDLLLESLISLITTNVTNVNNNALIKDITLNYVRQFEHLNQTIAGDTSAEIGLDGPEKSSISWEKTNDRTVLAYSENLYKYLFDDPNPDVNDLNRKNLHRIVTMTYSIVKKIAPIAAATAGGVPDLEASMGFGHKMFTHVLNLLLSFVNFWRVDFFNDNAGRKVLLSPGKDEWLSLQGFNEAIANEDNLEKIVESVFNVPKNEDLQNVRAIRRYNYILRQSLLKLVGLLILTTPHAPMVANGLKPEPPLVGIFEECLISIIDWIPVFHLYQILKYTLVPAVYRLTRLKDLLNKLQLRINQEWKSLNLFKSTNNAVKHGGKEDEGVENKVIHLYYLKVYACIDCGIEILQLCMKIVNAKTAKIAHDTSDAKEDLVKEDMMRVESIDSEISEGGTSFDQSGVLNNEELLQALLTCLCSALSWPHCRTINEALRIIRIYARLAPGLNVQVHIKFMYQLILYLSKHMIVPKTFNPLEIGGNVLNVAKGDGGNGNYVKEYVNTVCTLYEALVKCVPQISEVVVNYEVDVAKLLTYQHVVETLKLLTPYFQEQDCLLFIKHVLLQNSLKSRSLLKSSVQEKLKIGNASKYLAQFNTSSLETKSSAEIELCEAEGEEESILGNDILYLLLE